MATVRSTLVLEDRMSSTLSKVQQEALSNIQTFERLSNEIANTERMLARAEAVNPEIVSTEAYMQAAEGLDEMKDKLRLAERGFINIVDKTKEGAQGIQMMDIAMGNFIAFGIQKAISLAKQLGRQLIGDSDRYISNQARLGNLYDDVADKEAKVANLQNEIYKAAQRSRGEYSALTETVAKLGTQAKDAFSNPEEIVAFGELLNKTFTVSGVDSNAMSSIMYNLNQSLSTGRLLGNDYRILKMNAPQMIKYLQEFFQTDAAGLDQMVSDGKVTAQALKAAMFNASDDINKKFEQMPVTWGQIMIRIKNTIQKQLEPIYKIISNIAQFVNQHIDLVIAILESLAITLGIVTVAFIAHKAAVIGAAIAEAIFNGAALAGNILLGIKIALIFALVAAILYLWNTNDEAAYTMLLAWDGFIIGLMSVRLAFMAVWDMIASFFEDKLAGMIMDAQNFVNAIIKMLNIVLSALGQEEIGLATWGDEVSATIAAKQEKRTQDLNDAATAIQNEAISRNASREDRVANRKTMDSLKDSVGSAFNGALDGLTGTDGKGGKALKTTSNDDLLSDEDIQLLLDVATRDYKLNYQAITPNISVSFGDVRETADVDGILDTIGTRVQELINGDAEVVNA